MYTSRRYRSFMQLALTLLLFLSVWRCISEHLKLRRLAVPHKTTLSPHGTRRPLAQVAEPKRHSPAEAEKKYLSNETRQSPEGVAKCGLLLVFVTNVHSVYFPIPLPVLFSPFELCNFARNLSNYGQPTHSFEVKLTNTTYGVVTQFRNGRVPKVVAYVGWRWVRKNWFNAHVKDIQSGFCPRACTITANLSELGSADAVLIHLRSVESLEALQADLGPRDPSQPWVLFETETHLLGNSVHRASYRALDGVFNRTMSYRLDADVRFVHGFVVRRGRDASLLPPHWVRQINVGKRSRNEEFVSMKFRHLPVFEGKNDTRQLVVAFISNCWDNSGRLRYIEELRKHMRVDVFGVCGSLHCGTRRYAEHEYDVGKDPCLRLAARKYLFYLAFENALCTDYVTEKIYNMMYYPLVPVVRGAAEYAALLPPHSYVDAGRYTPEALARELQRLANHQGEYEKYLAWRNYYQPSTVGGARVLCDLCTRLHDQEFYQEKVVEDFYDWFVTRSNCNRSGTVRKRFKL
ncbi:4-galactosyl-N-acetylglucosaminide 3-alpha-L-fucosyltransferase FUT6-like [Penaeus vannamei]|uniref:4-galactosyl-N-acetylglucosaminide 3-alpha-L-fucosyltransferase FUT6-like n=1 Tax=Penaeus vannamei TaxID=6689 RepID=UPI00387F57F6